MSSENPLGYNFFLSSIQNSTMRGPAVICCGYDHNWSIYIDIQNCDTIWFFLYFWNQNIVAFHEWGGRGNIGICYIWMTNVLFPSLGDQKNGCITNTEYFKSAVPKKMPLKKILSHKSFQSLVFSVSKMCNNKCLTKSNIKKNLFLNNMQQVFYCSDAL